MDVVHRCCAGADVHKRSISVQVLRKGVHSKKDLQEVRTFGTMTRDLLELADWLTEAGCTIVAMESTGVYWKPVYNLLSAADIEVLLVNAKHIKNVPGRKTDVQDCQWIAQLLQHGLLTGSFIPSVEIWELRDLTRQRKQLVRQRVSNVQRIQKVLEDTNIKLSSVATDVTGKSGWEMLQRIVAGEDNAERLAELARGRLRNKRDQLVLALEGRVTDHHRFMLRQHMKQIEFLDGEIEEFNQRIEEHSRPFEQNVPLLTSIPGVGETSAYALMAELGVNMDQFPNEHHLSSWAGICPGNNESAGKHRSGKTRHGSKWLRSLLVEIAWCAVRTKGTYFHAQYRRLAARRGSKRAIVAVAHSILIVIYHIMKYQTPYQELGEHYFDTLNSERLSHHYKKRLESLGYEVEIKPKEPAA